MLIPDKMATGKTPFFQLFKRTFKKMWKKGSKYLMAAYAGYETHDIVDDLTEDRAIAIPNQFYRLPAKMPDSDDGISTSEVIIILLSIMIFLSLVIMIFTCTRKLMSCASKRGVKKHREQFQ